MKVIESLTVSVTVVAHAVHGGLERRETDRERGDVPGWVLITLMTAGLVTILWALAGKQLESLFTSAMSSVTGPGAR
jgi:hypothetical protein